MKIFCYRIIKESEYQAFVKNTIISYRASELSRWLSPCRMVYGNIFKYILSGKTSVESAREEILNDYLSVHREGKEKINADNFVERGR